MEGVKNVSMSEDFLEFHFPRFPVMPGALILEAIVQLAGWLEAAGSDFARWFLLEQVRSVKYYGFALPGDQIVLRVEANGQENGLNLFRGVATVEGERRVLVDFAGQSVEMENYEDSEEQKHLFRLLRREIKLA